LQQNDKVIVGKEYIVEANDNLQSIARRFGTTEADIVSLRPCYCRSHLHHSFHTHPSIISFIMLLLQLRINADLSQNAPLVPGSQLCVISKSCAFAN
jgi:spore germination protein YaaH